MPTFGSITPQTYSLSSTNGTTNYYITNNSSPTAGVQTITIGTQIWMQYNLNVGTKIAGTTTQTNNGTVEKYCYNDAESNCTIYGGLYQWDEMMQYVATEGLQGLCPAGFHIPTDAEWTTLINYLGSSTAGTQLKIDGSSGFNGLLGGYNSGSSGYLNLRGFYWSGLQYDSTYAYFRNLDSTSAQVLRSYYYSLVTKATGLSVRCIIN